MAPEVIAKENTIVHDDALGIDRQIIAGQPVPPDLVDAYRNEVGDKAADSSPGEDARSDASTTSYDEQTVDELQAEADRRNLTVEGTGKDGNVIKADLVAALEAANAE